MTRFMNCSVVLVAVAMLAGILGFANANVGSPSNPVQEDAVIGAGAFGKRCQTFPGLPPCALTGPVPTGICVGQRPGSLCVGTTYCITSPAPKGCWTIAKSGVCTATTAGCLSDTLRCGLTFVCAPSMGTGPNPGKCGSRSDCK